MASLVLGTVGGFLFGPIGFIAGSLIGNLLFPGKQEGPRLSNLKLQGSSYGQMIPIAYGTMRLAGQVVWQTDLIEHKHTSGGKGGPEVTTYSYTVSFAVKICKGPIAGINKIWANGEIIYDTTGSTSVDNSAVPIAIYLGVETALPDPRMETELGVGNVPAFRDDAAVVFADWDMGHFGNTLPQLSFEIFTHIAAEIERTSTWTVPQISGAQNRLGGTFDGTYITLPLLTPGASSSSYQEDRYDLQGNFVDTPYGPVTVINPTYNSVTCSIQPLLIRGFNSTINYMQGPVDGGITRGFWYARGVQVGGPFAVSGAGNPAIASGIFYHDGYVYAAGGSNVTFFLRRYPAPNEVPSSTFDQSIDLYAYGLHSLGSAVQITVSDDNYVYALFNNDLTGAGRPTMLKLSLDLQTIIHHWTHTDLTPYSFISDGFSSFVVYLDVLYIQDPTGPENKAWRINPDWTLSEIASIASSPHHYIVPLGACLALQDDGVVSVCGSPAPITLAEIVSDISVRSGLATSDIDVSQLTDLVDGYLITTRADARTDIDQLRTAYFFDAVESQGKAKFVKRGGAVVATIADDDLSARPGGDDPPPLVEVERMQELDLIAEVDVKYINSGAAYQDGAQQAIRQATLSQAVADVSLAIAMSDAKARQIANVLLYQTIVERDSGVFQTSRKYLYLEPTDVVSVHGYTMRIEKKTATTNGLVEFEGKFTIPAIYVVALASNATTGSGSPPERPTGQLTTLLLLDIPLVSDLDEQQAIYAAMAGAVDSTWRGASLYRSSDGGTTYTAVTSTSTATVMGVTQDVLADFIGGNMFDESSHVSVLIGAGGGTLSDATELAVLNGANIALLGSEIVQYKNATLTAPSTYTLSGFLRGRRGTEWHTRRHIAGERFVALPVLDVPSPFNDLGQQRQYKPVTNGSSLAATSAISFVDSGVALMPYAPTNLFGGINAAGDVVIDWTRRTRIGGAWVDFTDVPLSEPSELYVLQVWNADYTVCARVVTGLTSPTFTYTSAMQVTDFGAAQQTIYITVGQLGTYGLGIQTPAVIAGTGATVDAPLNPQTPYNTVPPTTPSGPGCVVAGSIINSTMTWSDGFAITSGAFTQDDVWVIKFTTPGSFGGSGGGGIDAFEFGGPQTFRSWSLALGPCGPLLPGAIPGNAMDVHQGFRFGSNPNPQTRPTLLPSTTYYLSIFTDDSSPMQAVLNFSLDP